jgi:hypothetical protein
MPTRSRTVYPDPSLGLRHERQNPSLAYAAGVPANLSQPKGGLQEIQTQKSRPRSAQKAALSGDYRLCTSGTRSPSILID